MINVLPTELLENILSEISVFKCNWICQKWKMLKRKECM